MSKINISNLVVLAAGLGSRLKPLTDVVPKCLTEINGQPMLLQTLRSFEQKGIKSATIVIGYFGQIIMDTIGQKIGNMSISYIKNPIYDQTNSSYSAWLAKTAISEGTYLVEGDTIYDDSIIESVTSLDDDNSYWVVDKFDSTRDGCMLVSPERGRINGIRIVRQRLKKYKTTYFKSCGLLRISKEYGKELVNWLEAEVTNENVKIYYDLVIEKHLDELPIFIHNIAGKKWEEIDNYEDLRRAERLFEPLKHVIVLIDGAADSPQSKLNGKTPLEYANKPEMDSIAKEGRCGLMKTMLNGLPVGSIVANMGILGYNPMRYYPNGRASFEALAKGITLSENDIAFRCNIISIKNGMLTDFTAENISDEYAQELIGKVAAEFPEIEIYPGQSYRNLLILRDVGIAASEIKCFEPHMNVGRRLMDLQNEALTDDAVKTTKLLNEFLNKSYEIIQSVKRHPNDKADGLFIWSPSSAPRLPSLHKKFGVDGAMVGAMDFLHGMAKASRMEYKRIPGATGYADTDLSAKLEATKDYLKNNEFIFLHINGADEESHSRNLDGKVKFIERVDEELVGPLRKHLDDNYEGKYRIAIMPDHYTYVDSGKHDDKHVPYVVSGYEIDQDDSLEFTEAQVNQHSHSIIKSYEFMNYFIKR
jgi:2,3-bisphosphoglycerate-independent phosphoglycerate mutase